MSRNIQAQAIDLYSDYLFLMGLKGLLQRSVFTPFTELRDNQRGRKGRTFD
jgi:hypothetical protein